MSQEKINTNLLFLKHKMLNEAKKYLTPLFWRGKRYLFFDINNFSQKTSLPITKILLNIGIDQIGLNCSAQSPDDANLYIGTLIADDSLYLTLGCKDDGSSYKNDIIYVM